MRQSEQANGLPSQHVYHRGIKGTRVASSPTSYLLVSKLTSLQVKLDSLWPSSSISISHTNQHMCMGVAIPIVHVFSVPRVSTSVLYIKGFITVSSFELPLSHTLPEI